ncbi:HSP20 family protein [Klebsormidium nitens]|uniref:HSP20 family protein n=1 Tax=Klebsormidium nitens TaxID=105231 RepID=A0A1Y1HPU7_KLENI|nr:HSP20 family protein [Klebsormidium nitens]|eukprot:GAQ78636.1 HSP20 family protein [Klebsormidium nitens]
MALSTFTGRDPFSDPFSDFVGPLGVTDPFFTGWGGRGLGDFFGGGGRGGNSGRDLSDDDRRRLRERAAILKTDVDWVEYPDRHVFFIDLPGVPKDNIKVQLEEGRTLAIRAERDTTPPGQDFTLHRAERGDYFFRRFRLPANVDTSKIEAKFRNGVLEVTVPKKEEAIKHETKDIPVAT